MNAETWERLPPNNEVFRRALEIALAGDHPLRVWRTALTDALEPLPGVTVVQRCGCGGLGSASLDCTCAPRLVNRIRRKQALHHYDLNTELSELRGSKAYPPEPWERVEARINLARASRPEVPTVLDSAGEQLYRIAHERLPLSDKQAASVREVARTIAALDFRLHHHTVIRAAHLAEAIQYQAPECDLRRVSA